MPRKKKYNLSSTQIANIVLAARKQSSCPKAIEFVKKIDRKHKLKQIVKGKKK